MITVSDFKTRFSNYSAVADALIQAMIDEAVLILNATYWGNKYDTGLLYYSAHLLTLDLKASAGATGSVGAVSGKSVDGVSVSYSVPSGGGSNDDWLKSTVYGQRYSALMATLGQAVLSV